MTNGKIIKINTDTFTILTDEGTYNVLARGKLRGNVKPLVGDYALIRKDTLTLESILPRVNKLNRPEVANIDIALVVTSLVSPSLNTTLLDKLLSIIFIEKITPVIVFTKIDKAEKEDKLLLKKLTKYYKSLGIKVFTNKRIRKLMKLLSGKMVTVVGQTGAGKSTLINKMDKKLNLQVKEISKALGRGVHTTRITEAFKVKDFYIVDTPGFSSIDISIYGKESIRDSFPEFNNTTCKYKDCFHLKEKGCTIIDNNNILKSRYNSYLSFINNKK